MSTPSASGPLFIPPGQGPATPGPGDLSITKLAASATSGQLHLREYRCDPGVGPPLHRHSVEDEVFWVLEGTVTFLTGERRHVAEPGSCVFAPRGLAHTFKNTGPGPARLLAMATPGSNSESFAAEFGSLMAEPGDVQQNMPRMTDICTRHGIEILGPNPL